MYLTNKDEEILTGILSNLTDGVDTTKEDLAEFADLLERLKTEKKQKNIKTWNHIRERRKVDKYYGGRYVKKGDRV